MSAPTAHHRRSGIHDPSPGEEEHVAIDPAAISDMKEKLGTTAEYNAIVDQAREATAAEHTMSIKEGFKLYPAAVLWSMLLSSAIIMEGYDVVLLGNFYALPQFNKKYGVLQSDGKYIISASWQAGLSNGCQVGEIIGLFINGIVSERYGYRKTMMVSLACMIAFIFIPFFAHNIQTLLIGEILQGMPWGVFQTLSLSYASEVCPVALRPHLTTYVNLCWIIGQLLAAGIMRGILTREDQWAYKIPFAIQWLWPAPILIGTLFAPESPWWLVRKGRHEDAKKVVRRLTSSSNKEFDVDANVAMMIHTNALEQSLSAGTSYWDCFKGIDLRRTEIACMCWSTQNICGSAFMGYSTYFMVQAGFKVESAFDMSIGLYAIGFVGTVSSWFMMSHLGRRTIFLAGLVILACLLLIIGFLGLAPNNQSAIWAVGGMLLVYTFIYDITIGPVAYCLVSEISSTRLRSKTVVIARNVYNCFGIVNSIIMPRFINSTALNWGAKTGWFWAGTCTLCLIWAIFRLPEPKGRTYGELDVLFEQHVPARKFKTTAVDQFADAAQSSSNGKDEKSDIQHIP